MEGVSLTGSDTIIINNRLVVDLADGDCVDVKYPNDLASVKTGKNGNSIYAFNESGRQTEVVMRLLRGSADDKFLNNLLVQMELNFSGFVLMNAEFVKKLGDGLGNVTSDTYLMSGGIFKRKVDAKNNVEGDSEQSVVIYTMSFSNGKRSIG